MKKILFLILMYAGIALISQCVKTTSTENIVGTGTLVGNPTSGLVGSLYYLGGTPAKNIVVHIRKQNSLAQAPGSNLANQSKDTASVTTDVLGLFAFDNTLDSGLYVIEAQSGGNTVLINSVALKNKTRTDTLPPDTLKPAGAIKGTIQLAGGGDPTNVYVLAFGIDRFAQVKSDGSFVFYPLAQGIYNLKLITTLENYGSLDTNKINVTSSDTTDLGAINLPYTGIPIPKSVALFYDTLKQFVIVHWSRVDSAKARTYNIYRNYNGPSDSTGQELLNSKDVIDTFFVDTTSGQDQTYWYQITVVDKKGNIGPKSAKAQISTFAAYVPVEGAFGQGQQSKTITFTMDANGNFWMADFTNSKIQEFGPTGNLITEWPAAISDTGRDLWQFLQMEVGCRPGAMAMDQQKNIYVTDFQGKSILKYDSSGYLAATVIDTEATFFDISVDENGNIYSNYREYSSPTTQWINKYNPDLTLKKTWKGRALPLDVHGLLARNGKVYCSGADISTSGHIIEIFDYEGAALQTIALDDGSSLNQKAVDLVMDQNGHLYFIDARSGFVGIMDEKFGFLGKFSINETHLSSICGIEVANDGTIIVGWASLVYHPDHAIIKSFKRR